MPKKPLSPRQHLFVDGVVSGLSATDAAQSAGYAERTALQQGSLLLINVDIAAAIAERRKKLETKSDITAERVLEEFGRIGFSDVRKYMSIENNEVEVHDSFEWSDADAAAVSEIRTVDGEDGPVVRLKLYNKIDALAAIARILGMNKDHLKVEARADTLKEFVKMVRGKK